jgi:hypothetical protein
MIELNLLPDVKQEFIRIQAQKKLIISSMIVVSIAAAGVVLLMVFFVFVAQPGLRLLVDNDVKSKTAELNKNKNLTRNLTIQNQLTAITQLHEDKGVYERFFDYFKSLNPETPNNISISQATLDPVTGIISLEASAKNFQAIAVFQDTLKNAELKYIDPSTKQSEKVSLFSAISISEAGLGQDGQGVQVASFKAALTYDPNAFAWAVTNPVVTVPNKSTTPSASQVSVFSATPPVKKEGE